MLFRHRKMQLVCGVSVLLTILALVITQFVNTAVPSAHAATNQFRGVNWADPRDNYANDPVVPSGLSTSDSYATTYAKSTAIIKGFATNLSANTVRLPINPYTVNGSFWGSYTGAIDAATAQGFKVILSYWEGTGSAKDGAIDNTTSFWTMWSTVTTKYASNSLVYFEPMNEPYSYSLSAWTNILVQWINTYPSIPKNRIISSGTGWNDNVTGVCADSRLAGTYLSLHDYGFNNTSQTSVSGWENDITSRIGSNCFSRTIVDEWGAPMTTGLNYDGAVNGSPYIAFIQAMAIVTSQYSMGAVYWPGLRNGDTYSMETLNGSGTNLSLTNNNASGVDQLKKAYGLTSGGGGGGGGGTLVSCVVRARTAVWMYQERPQPMARCSTSGTATVDRISSGPRCLTANCRSTATSVSMYQEEPRQRAPKWRSMTATAARTSSGPSTPMAPLWAVDLVFALM